MTLGERIPGLAESVPSYAKKAGGVFETTMAILALETNTACKQNVFSFPEAQKRVYEELINNYFKNYYFGDGKAGIAQKEKEKIAVFFSYKIGTTNFMPREMVDNLNRMMPPPFTSWDQLKKFLDWDTKQREIGLAAMAVMAGLLTFGASFAVGLAASAVVTTVKVGSGYLAERKVDSQDFIDAGKGVALSFATDFADGIADTKPLSKVPAVGAVAGAAPLVFDTVEAVYLWFDAMRDNAQRIKAYNDMRRVITNELNKYYNINTLIHNKYGKAFSLLVNYLKHFYNFSTVIRGGQAHIEATRKPKEDIDKNAVQEARNEYTWEVAAMDGLYRYVRANLNHLTVGSAAFFDSLTLDPKRK